MAEFQSVLGIILIVTAVVIIAIAIYNMIILGKATINTSDVQSTITDGERKGALAINAVAILTGLIIGIFGVIILLPPERATAAVSSLRGSRSLSGEVLRPGVAVI